MKKIPRLEYRTYGGKYQVTETWEYTLTINGVFDTLKIPVGYTTNGASIPRIFWWILSPFDPRYMEEATIHDNLCDKKQYQRADVWFEQLLIDNSDIAIWHRRVFIASVRAWHYLACQNAAYLEQAQSRRQWLKLLNKGLKKMESKTPDKN